MYVRKDTGAPYFFTLKPIDYKPYVFSDSIYVYDRKVQVYNLIVDFEQQ